MDYELDEMEMDITSIDSSLSDLIPTGTAVYETVESRSLDDVLETYYKNLVNYE